MRIVPLVLGALICAVPAAADFNAYYKGTQLDDGKTVPVTTQFSVTKGRCAMLFKGTRSARMLFLEKEGVLRIVDDRTKSIVDLDRQSLDHMKGDVASAMEQAKAQMAQLPPEQRAMMEKMMHSAMNAPTSNPPDVYVRSDDKQTVNGYECTRVSIMAGSEKRAEYWGTTSADFKLSEDDRKTVLAMQDYLRSYTIQVASMGGGGGDAQSRAFTWDTSVEGFPLISRCFHGATTTLDLKLDASDRKAVSGSLFEVPSGYKKREMPTLSEGGKKHQ